MTIPDPFDVDVVVIGAGFSGLTVATELRHHGVSFVVVEARDRVGGKTESLLDPRGSLVDTGGQFANHDMTEVLALATSVGATVVNSDHPGSAVTVPTGLDHEPWAVAEAQLATLGADHLDDSRSAMDWAADSNVPHPAMEAFRSAIDGSTCHDSYRVPVSYLAQLNMRSPSTHPELQLWFSESMHSLAVHLADGLGPHVRLESPVRGIHLHDESVDVVAADQVWHAREVVVAVPPSAYAGLGFTPALPDDIAQAAAAFSPGTVLKYLLGYAAPFWTQHGRNGIGQFLSPPGLYFTDASLPGTATLVGFVGGTTAREWSRHSERQRHEAIAYHAAVAFGPAALEPHTVVERLWAPDEWGGGGYSNVQTTHAPHAADVLAIGMPLVTFASTELSLRFPGYVEGAITAGKAAAHAILSRLGRAPVAGV